MQSKNLVWLGISMQKNTTVAFDNKFVSGKLLSKITDQLDDCLHHKLNLVDVAPLDDKGKIRYPTTTEIDNNRADLLKKLEDINPLAIITMGRIVTESLSKALHQEIPFPASMDYSHADSKWPIIAVHHPSFIAVYKRSAEEKYITEIISAVKELLGNSN